MVHILINSDKAHELLKKCDILREYSQFIDTVKKAQLRRQYGNVLTVEYW